MNRARDKNMLMSLLTDTPIADRYTEPRPSSGAAPFEVGEIFYSRTDRRGIIQSGNSVFQRVAHFNWSELLGAPHRVIRHPDMPRGVFHIMWDHLLSGRTVGAYVKNRAKDGLHYWVFAIATPHGDGFLSARMKPTSTRLREVEALYAAIRSQENSEGISPKDSAARIMAALGDMGFGSYDDFAVDSLAGELTAERAVLGQPLNTIRHVHDTLRKLSTLRQQADELISSFAVLHGVPRNLQIKARTIEPSGGPLTALSQDYSMMSHDMETWFKANVLGENNNFDQIGQAVRTILYGQTVQDILSRCLEQIATDAQRTDDPCDATEQAALKETANHLATEAAGLVKVVMRDATGLLTTCQRMNRTLIGLNTVRVTGKIENARLGVGHDDLATIIAQLGTAQERVEAAFKTIQAALGDIVESVERMREGPVPSE